jgi:hypothetical protein
MLSREDHRPAVHVRIAAFEADDFNMVIVLVSDKQDYSFGQTLPKRSTGDRLAQRLGDGVRFAARAVVGLKSAQEINPLRDLP